MDANGFAPPPAPLPAAEAAVFPVSSSLRHANKRPRPTHWSSPQTFPLYRCWLWLTVTPDLPRYTSSPTHANSTGLLQEASENRNEKRMEGSKRGNVERRAWWKIRGLGGGKRETVQERGPLGSVSILVSEVEKWRGQWQLPWEASVYSPTLRP